MGGTAVRKRALVADSATAEVFDKQQERPQNDANISHEKYNPATQLIMQRIES